MASAFGSLENLAALNAMSVLANNRRTFSETKKGP